MLNTKTLDDSILDSDLEPSSAELDAIEHEDFWPDDDREEYEYWPDDYDYEEFD